jgi:hypothetical protein
VTYYPKSAYGSNNPNAGRPANGNASAWGGYQWPNCPPSSLMGYTSYVSASADGQKMSVQLRTDLVPLWNLLFEIADRKYHYPTWAKRNGENWGPWGMDCRAVSGTSTPSGHSMALSVDINAPYNGYSTTWQCDMPPEMVADFEACGLYWGGRYTGKYDPMHYGYCYSPADVPRHIDKARSLLGGQPPIPPEEITVPLTVMRTAGVDYGYDADAMSLFIRIPTEAYYKNLQYLDIVKVDHGKAKPVEQNIVDWLRGQVAGSGGRVYEPAE